MSPPSSSSSGDARSARGSKRRYGDGGSSRNNHKRRRYDAGFSSSSSREFTAGSVGYLVSTLRLKESQAARELSTVLNERILAAHPDLADAIAASASSAAAKPAAESEEQPAQAVPQAETAAADVEDELAREIEAERSGARTRAMPLSVMRGGAQSCLAMLLLHPAAVAAGVKPSELLPPLFDDVRERGLRCSRYVQRCVPMDATCASTKEDIVAAVQGLSTSFIGNGQCFAVHIKIRKSPKLSRDDVIAAVADIFMDAGHKVNLTTPEISIVLEVIANVTGVSVLAGSDFLRCRKFNFHEMRIAGENSKTSSTDTDSKQEATSSSTSSETVAGPASNAPSDEASSEKEAAAAASAPIADATTALPKSEASEEALNEDANDSGNSEAEVKSEFTTAD